MVSDLEASNSLSHSQHSFLPPPSFVANRRAGKKSVFTQDAILPSASSSPLLEPSPKLDTSVSSRSRPGACLPRTSLGTVAGRVSRTHRHACHSSPRSPIRAQILRRDFLADEIESLASWSSSPVHAKLGRYPGDYNIVRPAPNRRNGLGRVDPSSVLPSSPASFVTAIEVLPTPSPFPLSASNTPTPPPSERLISTIKVSSPAGNATTNKPVSSYEVEQYTTTKHHSGTLVHHNYPSSETTELVNSNHHPDKMALSLIHPNISNEREDCTAMGSPLEVIRPSQSSIHCVPTEKLVSRFGDGVHPFNTTTQDGSARPSQDDPVDPNVHSVAHHVIDDSVTINYVHSPVPCRRQNQLLPLSYNDPHHPYSGRAWRAQGSARPVHLGFSDPPSDLHDMPRATVEPVWTDEQIRTMFTTASDGNIANNILSPQPQSESPNVHGLQTPGVGTTYQRWYAGKENLPPALRATMTQAEQRLWDEPPANTPTHFSPSSIDDHPRQGRSRDEQAQAPQDLRAGDGIVKDLAAQNAVNVIIGKDKPQQASQTEQHRLSEMSSNSEGSNAMPKVVQTPKCAPPQKMAKVYKLSEDTIHKLRVMPGLPDRQTILFAAAEATEFHKYPIHPDQRAFFSTIYHDVHLPYPVRIDEQPQNSKTLPHTPAHKILLLVQTDLGGSGWPPSRLSLNARKSLIRERVQMYKSLETVLRCAVDVLGQLKDAQGVRNALYLLRSVSAGSWDEPSFELLQLDNIGIKRVERLNQAGVTTVKQLKTKEFYDLERLLSRNPPFGHQLKHRLMHFPDLKMRVNLVARATDKPDMVVIGIVFQFSNQITDTQAQAVLAVTDGGVVANIPQKKAQTGSSGITMDGVPRWKANTAPRVTFMAERAKDKHLLHFWRGNLKVMKGEGKSIIFGCRAVAGDVIILEMACETIAGTTVSQTIEAP